MPSLDLVGSEWISHEVHEMSDSISRVTPVAFNEENRYLPQGVSPRPGYIRYDLFPFLEEIIDCFDIDCPVREVNVLKGVQVGYTTLLESVMFYYMAHIKTQPMLFITADKELAKSRVENNILPMINESGFGHIIRSSDEGNSRKTGKTKDFLQWDGGGSLFFNGALNAAKMRMLSVPVILKDEMSTWKVNVGNDGNSDALTDARASAYWGVRKILRGSTPLLKPDLMHEAYQRGDQRKYMILCKACGFPQVLRQEYINKENGIIGGFQWDMESGSLVLESVRYCCINCGQEHFESDKEKLFSKAHGAHWAPTATAREPGIRSYHLPSFYSPFGFRPWYKAISDYLDSFDPVAKQVKSVSRFQEYYNNTLGVPFEVMGSKVRFSSVSSHRRAVYRLGSVPNGYAAKNSGSKILFLTCQVDVHLRNLAVSVMGWTRDSRCYLIDYWRFERRDESDDCTELTSPVWQKLREVIEEKVYEADDGTKYRILLTLIDAGFANATVTAFCGDYEVGVYPILGRDRPSRNQTIKEFAEFKTQAGTVGYRIVVDHYKDRLAPVLRRDWTEEMGEQRIYHFNAPVDVSDKQLKELTVESRREKTDDKGNTVYYWHRPGSAANELWDLLGYGHAAVEILAWSICIGQFKMENVDWNEFWDYAQSEDGNDVFGRLA